MTMVLERPKTGTLPPGRSKSGLYQVVWRWHFYAALFVVPFILVFALTGSLYLFQPQIENWLYRDLYTVAPGVQAASPDAQVQAALACFAGAQAEAYLPPAAPDKSAQVRLVTNKHAEMTVAVNPYTGHILGAIDDRRRPMQTIRDLHGKLLAGKTGQMIQELAASWALILIITGLYLWWPRRGSKLWGIFLPRLQTPGRLFWRDLHAVTGFWVSGLLVFLILTGLPWSVVSGDLIHQAAARLGKGSPNTGIGWSSGGSRTVKSKPVGQDWATTHAQQMAGLSSSQIPAQLSGRRVRLSLTRVLQLANGLPGIQAPFEVRLPVDPQGVFTIITEHDSNPARLAYIHLDQYSGRVVKDIRWNDFGPLAQAIALGVALHEGRYFGLANQLLGLAACLGLILMIVAGLAMWWQRRPLGSLGAPSLPPPDFKLPMPVIAAIGVLALLMPLLGASLVFILAVEWLGRYGLIRRNRLRRKKALS